ncbi:molecular chaperone [Deinococcus sp. JMULE3]|uniref:fimbrial biogenesis chaperone n=1 Tax=Deinococcus sp. JMULE3 TaxID=2518341 RepID=UPI001576C9EC|nr:fimbria/pilus periplasmic chaperone [Deinococcus sp. JMULE3]NTX99409.1 molecular chaperone [Deinococcus sp. JMULE3]
MYRSVNETDGIRTRRAGRALLALTLTALAGAQGFGFTPTALNLDPTRSLSTQTTMLNTTRVAAKFTVTARAWRVEDGRMVLADTRDLLVNPAEFILPGGASQVVRVGLRKKPGAAEVAYRLFVQQVPYGSSVPQTTVAADGIDVRLDLPTTFSLPVYVAPPGAAARMTYDAQRQGNDLILRVANSGTRHETFNALRASRGGARVDLSSMAVLGGAAVTLTLPGLGAASGELTLEFLNADARPARVTVRVP